MNKNKLKHHVILSEDNMYGNISVYSPEMQLMFYANQKKLNFYIKNKLVDKISDTEYKLNFTPGGLGNYGTDNLFRRINICVVSGGKENLTRHHIIPSLIRRNFPLQFKDSDGKMIVLIERDLHDKYNLFEKQLLDKLAEQYGVKKIENYASDKGKLSKIKSAAKVIVNYNENVPPYILRDRMMIFRELTGKEPTKENLDFFINLTYNEAATFGREIAEKITDYKAFERLWFQHFVEHMKPQFLPEDLKLKFNYN